MHQQEVQCIPSKAHLHSDRCRLMKTMNENNESMVRGASARDRCIPPSSNSTCTNPNTNTNTTRRQNLFLRYYRGECIHLHQMHLLAGLADHWSLIRRHRDASTGDNQTGILMTNPCQAQLLLKKEKRSFALNRSTDTYHDDNLAVVFPVNIPIQNLLFKREPNPKTMFDAKFL